MTTLHKHIMAIPAFQDNYIWLVQQQGQALVVDPGDASPVLDVLERLSLQLAAILITHHHHDHTDGVHPLMQVFPRAKVYCPEKGALVHPLARHVNSKDVIHTPEFDCSWRVIETPGHTRDHISYTTQRILFCGDTLFAGGCGRLFEGSAKDMYDSLQRLSALDDETQVYCAHEYTQANLQFCSMVEPDNQLLQQRMQTVSLKRQQGIGTIPSTLLEEKKTNCFLRVGQPSVQQAVSRYTGRPIDNEIDCFSALRQWKDTI